MRAIISVSNKTGIADFARGLQELGIEIFSTGGTKKSLEAAGIKVHSVSELTGFPEILDGRVKTLHPAVHGGILARRDLPQHLAELSQNRIELIDIVAVNLYPFVETVSKADVSLNEALENIDIGGPTMLRSAAKNFPSVLVIVDPKDYDPILRLLRGVYPEQDSSVASLPQNDRERRTRSDKGDIDLKERKRLAQKAFQHVAIYDTAIAQYLSEETFPEEMTIALKKGYSLRYGENPHQQAAFYIEQNVKQRQEGLASLIQLSGPEISFNNLLDLDAALNVLSDFAAPTVTIMKHNNSCGLASHDDLAEAYRRALTGDPVAAFGGVVAANRAIDLSTAEEIDKTHYDAIMAPEYEKEALELLQSKKSLRLFKVPMPDLNKQHLDFRYVKGGFLVQSPDFLTESEFQPRVVSNRTPTEEELFDLLFAWKAAKSIKSNAIVIAKDNTLLGMGAGQPSRVVSVKLALERAGDRAKGSVLASDAFFPFSDGPELAIHGGVTAIIQPGGSVKDSEVIEIANKHNVAMVFTGVRHFRH
ncbi:MAG: bifunctional phosphoribosylaminoimidazolecarboxamide formyltransferase/inosine monophosphate cyclohydrolase [Chloroflexi bacterium CG_4_9_14_3_um_filter_45_9]|nr:MAG: bifunctional phosphoribosylaminoimidazolecarboxamide formyltransferase/inosine monophosphate cyclohydrolase [Dehalococcoidia bacterium CG2_30_46_9]PIU23086.1 MAG: bifunctional phosphoribosylaminoimidazolecarboxamide formyltransferase/inosine monophosphate cyclohydrolase [Chloroflexi bacterium CG08_land_8_20_14_0_20_45_12]PIX27207.1 MAG: bifunctional phosphoribosylaminoimidazolecarboxamide formyltransferase/inosine monophosphate cyclohydrolase [Chloroflexi bacterium CG_4_8_14_3_um_filter_4